MSEQPASLPNGFRDTPLGPLPEDWRVVRLGEIAEVKYGKANPNDSGSIPIVGSGGIFANTSTPLVTHPTLVIGRKGTAGKVWLFLSPCYPSDTTFYLHWKKEIDVSFVFYFLNLRPLSGEHAKTTLPSLQKPYLENTSMPLPPLAEQRAIAHVLTSIQRAIEATEQVIAATRELKKSLMRHLFTYGPVPPAAAESVPLQETEIGPIPAHWQVVRLGEVAEVRAGVAFPPKYQGKATGKYPFFKVADMNAPGNERYMKNSNNWIHDDLLPILKAKPFPKHTVIFPKVGGALLTNKKRLLSRESLVDNNIMGVIVQKRDRCIPEFCFCWFESIDIREFSNPGPLPSINAQTVKQSPIPLPPLPEQQRIAEMLRAVDGKIQAEERRKAALQSLFKSMLHYLMTGKVRVAGLVTPPTQPEE